MFASTAIAVPTGGSSRPTPLECRALTEMLGKHVKHHLMLVDELKPPVASWGMRA